MDKKFSTHYKYNLLISELRKKIFSGEFSQGKKLPSERKLSEQFGFSRVTIRTALKELKEDALIEQRRGAGTFVTIREKKTESSLPKKKYRFCFFCNAGNMGLAPEADPYNARILLGVCKARSKENDFNLEICSVPEEDFSFEKYIKEKNKKLSAWDGFLIVGTYSETDIDFLTKNHAKFVLFGEREIPRYFPVVTSDNFKAGAMLAEYLIRRGRKKPVILFSNQGFLWEKHRHTGFCQTFAKAGLDEPAVLFAAEDPKTIGETKKIIRSLLKKRPFEFDSIVIPRDMQAIGVLEAMANAKINVPEQIDVVAFDAYSYLKNMFPNLPAITQPFAEMGEAAAETLLSMLKDKNYPVTIKILQPKFNMKLIENKQNNLKI